MRSFFCSIKLEFVSVDNYTIETCRQKQIPTLNYITKNHFMLFEESVKKEKKISLRIVEVKEFMSMLYVIYIHIKN
jgi:hypothetical protein